MLLPEPDRGVGRQQQQDDAEVRPVPQHPRQDHRSLDHPRDRPPEVGQQLQERIFLLLRDLIRPVPGQPLGRPSPRQAIRRRPQPLLHLRHRKGLQVILRIRHRAPLRSGDPWPAGAGFLNGAHAFLPAAGASHPPARTGYSRHPPWPRPAFAAGAREGHSERGGADSTRQPSRRGDTPAGGRSNSCAGWPSAKGDRARAACTRSPGRSLRDSTGSPRSGATLTRIAPK